MEDAKKNRSDKGRMATRRTNELNSAISQELPVEELESKIGILKEAMEELGLAQDKVLEKLEEDNDKEEYANLVEELEIWYFKYVEKANSAIRMVGLIKKEQEIDKTNRSDVKIDKLKLPKFDSSPKSYF